jgi:hypothetical protein
MGARRQKVDNGGMDLPPSVARVLVKHPALGRLATRASQAFILWRAQTVGMPETATCADVVQNPRKREMVAKAVYEELVGMEESERRIHGDLACNRPVAERFPRGYKEVEPLVEEACDESSVTSPYSTTLRRIREELKQ